MRPFKNWFKKSVDAQAVVAGITVSDWGTQGGQPHEYNEFDQVSRAYQLSETVFACVRAVAVPLAGVPLKSYRMVGGVKTEFPESKILAAIVKPNRHMSGYDLQEAKFADRKLSGNAYWYVEKFSGQIYRLLPEHMKVVTDKIKFIKGYIYQAPGGEEHTFTQEEIVHFKTYNPRDNFYGQSAIQALKWKLLSELYATQWNASLLANSAEPDVVIEANGNIAEHIKKRILAFFDFKHSGPTNKGKTAILEGGAKVHPYSLSPKDMEWLAGQKLTLEAICRGMGTPPGLVGNLEYANYSVMDAQRQILAENELIPTLLADASTLNRDLVPLFGSNEILEYDLSKVPGSQQSLTVRSAPVIALVSAGLMTANEGRRELKLGDSYEGGDVFRILSGFPTEVGREAPKQDASKAISSPVAQRGSSPLLTRGSDPESSSSRRVKGFSPQSMFSTEDARVKEWKAFDAGAKKFESGFAAWVQVELDKQEARVTTRLAAKIDTLKAMQEEFTESYRGMMNDHYKEGVATLTKAKGTIALQLMPMSEDKILADGATGKYATIVEDVSKRELARLGVETAFSLDDPRARKLIEAKKIKFAKEVNATTRDALAKTLGEGLAGGETILELKARVEYEFDGRRDNAATIARTEVVSASNASRVESYKIAEVVERKEWLSARDSVVREAHRDPTDGQVVALDEPFDVAGEFLMYPGDLAGSPENTINCRCVVVPLLKGDEEV